MRYEKKAPPIPSVPPQTQLFRGTSWSGRKLHWGIKYPGAFTNTGMILVCQQPKHFELFPQKKLPAHLKDAAVIVDELTPCYRCTKIRPFPKGTAAPFTAGNDPRRPRRDPLTHTIAAETDAQQLLDKLTEAAEKEEQRLQRQEQRAAARKAATTPPQTPTQPPATTPAPQTPETPPTPTKHTPARRKPITGKPRKDHPTP